MSDGFRVTTHRSWFGRIGSSFAGALFGLLLVLAGVVCLFWNEGRAVTTARSLAEGASVVVSAPAEPVDPANEGHLVHVTGPLTTASQPADPLFGIATEGVRLVRHAQMYQWREESHSESEKRLGGGEDTVTTYSYSKGWEDHPVDSSEFQQAATHANPEMTVQDGSFQVPEAKLGAFSLRGEALDEIGGAQPFLVKADQADALRAAYGGGAKLAIVGGRIYLGADPAVPAVGDTRVSFEVVPLGPVSMIGRQSGGGLDAYPTHAGDRLLIAARGDVPAEKMFADAVADNTVLTWVLRAVGLIVLGIGFALVVSPLGVVADVIPFLGSLVRMGTSLVALVLTLLVGSVTIALAWFWFRPLIGLAILAAGVVVAYLVTHLGRAKAPAGEPKPASA